MYSVTISVLSSKLAVGLLKFLRASVRVNRRFKNRVLVIRQKDGTRTNMVTETSVDSPFNQLTRLLARVNVF